MPDTRLPELYLPDPNGFTNALAAGMKMRRYQDEGDAAARKEEDAIGQRNALSAYLSGDRSPDSLRRLGGASPQAALAIEKSQSAAALNTAKIDSAKLDATSKKLGVISQLLTGVIDDPSYQQVRAQVVEIEPNAAKWPQRYDPAFVQITQRRGLKVKEQLDLQLQTLNVNSQIEERGARTDIAQGHLDVAQGNAAETARYHDASLAGQEDRFQRGQEGTDRRAQNKQAAIGARTNTALRKEFNGLPAVKNYTSIVPIVQSAREATTTDTPAADMNLVYAAAKVMDPESVVRESETSMVVSAGSPAQQLLGQWNYVTGGGRLTAPQRKQLMDEIESRAKGHEGLYNDAVKQYRSGAPEIGSLPTLGAGRDRQATPGAPTPASPETDQRRQRAIEAIRRARGMVP